MSVAVPPNLNELLRHEQWLREQLAENAKKYLEMLEQLKTLEPDSDEYATLNGELYAQVAQVEMDATDVAEIADTILDALPEDD